MLGRCNCVGTDVDSIAVRTVLFTPIFALPFPWSHKMRPFLKSCNFNHSCLWITSRSKYHCIWLGKKFISFFIYSLDGFWGLIIEVLAKLTQCDHRHLISAGLNYIGLLSNPSVDLKYIRLFSDISMDLKYIRLLSPTFLRAWNTSECSPTFLRVWNTSGCSPTLLRAENTSGCSPTLLRA